jgi:small subunit ribosomal protein S8
MSCSDPIADMLTIIRNGVNAGMEQVRFPHSKLKGALCQVLVDEGFIRRFEMMDTKPAKQIKVWLKYGPDGERVINTIRRVSRPGCRIYRGKQEMKPVCRGFGISIISTSKGVMSDRNCRAANLGGEILCVVQ